MQNIFLDDVRTTIFDNFVVIRNYEGFVAYIKEHGVPDFISFDHDLGNDWKGDRAKTGYDCALYLVENNLPIKDFAVHSSNPDGAKLIVDLLKDWQKGIKPAKLNWEDEK